MFGSRSLNSCSGSRAIITMAHDLKIEVVAEGVETAEQHALLLSPGCDEVQGIFWGSPCRRRKARNTWLPLGVCLPVIPGMTGAKSEISVQILEKA
ncbi:EAL domain-containing protein [Thiolapillus sp.]